MIDWMNNPSLTGIDPMKLELLKTAVEQTKGKKEHDLAPILLGLITSANKTGLRFSAEEIGLILELMKEGKSEKERAQIEKTAHLAATFLNTHK